jgi:hypothetical protein
MPSAGGAEGVKGAAEEEVGRLGLKGGARELDGSLSSGIAGCITELQHFLAELLSVAQL